MSELQVIFGSRQARPLVVETRKAEKAFGWKGAPMP
jgi:hypothetical protein